MHTAESAGQQQPCTLTSLAARAEHAGFVCFVCSRCEYPICTADDVLQSTVTDGTTESAFRYQLDDLLDLNCAVPCYSAEETTNTAVTVSGRLLEVPLLPTARLLALTSIVESHAYARTLAEELLSRRPAPSATHTVADHSSGSTVVPDPRRRGDAVHTDVSPIRHYGATTSCRVDLIGVRMGVLQHGLAISRLDRSTGEGDETWARGGDDAVRRDDGAAQQASQEAVSHCPPAQASSVAPIPYDVLAAAHRAPPATQWKSPGNFAVEEAYMIVTRSTDSARHRWFTGFDCVQRVECPDCHLALGFVFARTGTQRAASGDSEVDAVQYSDVRRAASEPTFVLPESSQRERARERGASAAFPDHFVGLELKRIRQRQWGLHEFHVRYSKAQQLTTFRTLFPEAEELQSLYHRLTALRTQAELYKNLLRKHKEQYDVQNALLQTHKERIVAYEKQSQMMQQVINKLRVNLDMQTTQIRSYSELLQSHRLEIRTQQQQIIAQQQLLTRQSQSIDLQQAEIRRLRGEPRSSDALAVTCDAADMQSHLHRVILGPDENYSAETANGQEMISRSHHSFIQDMRASPLSGQQETTCTARLAATLPVHPCISGHEEDTLHKNAGDLLSSTSIPLSSPCDVRSSVLPGMTALLPPRHLLGIYPHGSSNDAASISPSKGPVKEEEDVR